MAEMEDAEGERDWQRWRRRGDAPPSPLRFKVGELAGTLERRLYFFPFSSGSRNPEYCTSISSTTTSSLAIASKIR